MDESITEYLSQMNDALNEISNLVIGRNQKLCQKIIDTLDFEQYMDNLHDVLNNQINKEKEKLERYTNKLNKIKQSNKDLSIDEDINKFFIRKQ